MTHEGRAFRRSMWLTGLHRALDLSTAPHAHFCTATSTAAKRLRKVVAMVSAGLGEAGEGGERL